MRTMKLFAIGLLVGCGGGDTNQAAGTELDISVCAASNGAAAFSADITNRFFPMPVGQKLVLEGGGERVEITALAETEVVAGVTTRVVQEYETEHGVLVEQSWNYFAQAADGTVCYFGERVDIYEGGSVTSHEGQWRADDQRGFAPGIQMPAAPAAGTYHAQERAPGVAEDYANIVQLGKPVSVPAGMYAETVIVEEWSPLEPGSKSHKAYAAGVGILDDDGAVLVEIQGAP
jgi:hypothetical protein